MKFERNSGLRMVIKSCLWKNLEEYMMNSSMDALREAQRAFAGEAERLGLKDDDDVMTMIKELREESVVK